jgi:hypothetical protein
VTSEVADEMLWIHSVQLDISRVARGDARGIAVFKVSPSTWLVITRHPTSLNHVLGASPKFHRHDNLLNSRPNDTPNADLQAITLPTALLHRLPEHVPHDIPRATSHRTGNSGSRRNTVILH